MKLFASRGMQGVNVQLFDERLGINETGEIVTFRLICFKTIRLLWDLHRLFGICMGPIIYMVFTWSFLDLWNVYQIFMGDLSRLYLY